MIRATDDVEKVRLFIGQGLLQLVGAVILLTGTIIGRQTDRRSSERKYLVEGRTADDTVDLVVVVKFGFGATLVIVTVYAN